jgi:hypothetical protein
VECHELHHQIKLCGDWPMNLTCEQFSEGVRWLRSIEAKTLARENAALRALLKVHSVKVDKQADVIRLAVNGHPMTVKEVMQTAKNLRPDMNFDRPGVSSSLMALVRQGEVVNISDSHPARFQSK